MSSFISFIKSLISAYTPYLDSRSAYPLSNEIVADPHSFQNIFHFFCPSSIHHVPYLARCSLYHHFYHPVHFPHCLPVYCRFICTSSSSPTGCSGYQLCTSTRSRCLQTDSTIPKSQAPSSKTYTIAPR